MLCDKSHLSVCITIDNGKQVVICDITTLKIRRMGIDELACDGNYVTLFLEDKAILQENAIPCISYAWLLSLLFAISRKQYFWIFTKIMQLNYSAYEKGKWNDIHGAFVLDGTVRRVTETVHNTLNVIEEMDLGSIVARELAIQKLLEKMNRQGVIFDCKACKDIFFKYKQMNTNLPSINCDSVDALRIENLKLMSECPEFVFGKKENKVLLNTHFKVSLSCMRIYTSKFNLQGLSKEYRKCIRCEDDYLIVEYDIASCQAVLLSLLANQQDLLNDYADGVDIYSIIAANLFDSHEANARCLVKILFILMVFGAGLDTIAEDLSKEGFCYTPDDIQGFIRKILLKYVNIAWFMENAHHMRQYMLPSGRRVFSNKSNNLLSLILQGVESDLMREIMLRLDDFLQNDGLGRICYPIHDALIIAAKKDSLKQLRSIVEKTVNDVFSIYFSRDCLIKIKEELVYD